LNEKSLSDVSLVGRRWRGKQLGVFGFCGYMFRRVADNNK
jgi:hypothetical protein